MNHNESEAVESNQPCEECGANRGVTVYDDGHTHCHACQNHTSPTSDLIKGGRIAAKDAQPSRPNATGWSPAALQFKALNERCIRSDTCRTFEYGWGVSPRGERVHMTQVRAPSGEVIAQKIRTKDKRFISVGPRDEQPGFWGQHLFQSAPRLVITEGEIDAMSVYEAMGSKWPVVSLPDGTGSVKKTFKAAAKWLQGFKEVVVMFDEDDAGHKATAEAVKLLPPGIARVAKLSMNDPNEMWRAGLKEELKQCVWNAQSSRPDTILGGDRLRAKMMEHVINDMIPFPWLELQTMWKGSRSGDLTLIGAGSGVGKTTVVKTLLYNAIEQGDKIGAIFLEEGVKTTMKGLLTCHIKMPVHLTWMGNFGDMGEEDRNKILEGIDYLDGKVELYDHWGSMEPEELVRHLRYMAVGLGCKTLVLDHITMLANAAEEGGERLILDSTTQKLRAMIEETGVRLFVVSHLNRPKGRPFEEGAQVHVGSFRGSTQLVCLADNVLGIERNQQHDTNSNFIHLRSLKCRLTGFTGTAGWLEYSRETGCLMEVNAPDGGLTGEAGANEEETY